MNAGLRRIRAMINPKSGTMYSSMAVLDALQQYWDIPAHDLTIQYSKSIEDGQRKARTAIRDGVDTILVVGGDGMVNSIGAELIGSDVALGVIPTGSGNGFARHFDIPLDPAKAAKALANATRKRIDVGRANGRSFFVTCSMAWDATIVRSFEKSPVRGVWPYVFAAVYEFLGFVPQPIEVKVDGNEPQTFNDSMVFTIANLTQFGGGARIAPKACPDDGFLELVVILRQDGPKMLPKLVRLFDGTLDEVPEVITKRFQHLSVKRSVPSPIQIDGELVELGADIEVEVVPDSLTVLVPRGESGQ